ncbi:MAG: hypothetical protein RSE33_20535 [Hafnia sp.]
MAQEKSSGQRFSPIVQGWYAGVQGGVPFGVSTFSFNHTGIAASEQPKLQVLLETLRQHSDVQTQSKNRKGNKQ